MAAPGSVSDGSVVGSTISGISISETSLTSGDEQVASFTVNEILAAVPLAGSEVPDDTYACVGSVLDPNFTAAPIFYSQVTGLYFVPGLDPNPISGLSVNGISGEYPNDLITNYADGSSASYDYATEMETVTPCFCRGTLIATPEGHTNVERLFVGQLVLTASGQARPIRWIGRRSYSARFVTGRRDLLPICVKAHAFAESMPSRDLFMSPLHAVFVENVLIPINKLANGVSVVQLSSSVGDVEYLHIELETHDVVLAEDLPVETFLEEGNRGIFQNAHEYREDPASAVNHPRRACARRLEDGHEVNALRLQLKARAGRKEVTCLDGELRGAVDLVDGWCVRGWAQNAEYPEAPVCLDIMVDGALATQVLANEFRPDLNRLSLGSGRHGFTAKIPGTIAPPLTGRVEVRRSSDGAALLQLGKFLAA